jgi:hypothetical protein
MARRHRARQSMHELRRSACDRSFTIRTHDPETAALMEAAFGGMSRVSPLSETLDRDFDIAKTASGYHVSSRAAGESTLPDADQLLFHIDKDITIWLQLERRDLFFIHAAAVARGSRVIVLTAPSGTGKSTFVLSLIEKGLEYLSDELAPIDLGTLAVKPYPHALCLKSPPPAPYALPSHTLQCGRRYHVPVPGPAQRVRTLAALVFVRRDEERFERLRPISAASAAARLMANALNPLAHPGDGLDVAVMLSQAVPCFELDIQDLSRAGREIEGLFSMLEAG